MLTITWSYRRTLLALSLFTWIGWAQSAATLAQATKSGNSSSDFILGQEPKSSASTSNPGFGQEPKSTTATSSITGKSEPGPSSTSTTNPTSSNTSPTTSTTNAGFGVDPMSTGSSGQKLRPSDPGFLVRVDVNRALRSYREGDPLSMTVAAEADAYVYVLYKQADGQVFQVFPNASHPDNHLKARQAVKIPADNDMFRWVVSAPYGKEVIKVLASKEPLTGLADAQQRAKFFTPVSNTMLKGVQLELGNSSRQWAEDTTEITTYPANQVQQVAGARRYGLFIGLGQYEHIAMKGKAEDGSETNVYKPGHRDARTISGVMQEVGQLNALKVLTNEEANREKVEDAMTRWLPSVSQPGDTVIVFFSGVAAPVSKATGIQDNSTRDSSVILPLHDFMSASRFDAMKKARTDGKLPSEYAGQLRTAEQLAYQGGTQAVVRRWGITDDLFAYWLQGLAGRQVIVLLDTPYASAFAPQTAASGQPLVAGVSRLGNLGQQNIALLGACGEAIDDVARDPNGLSLMTELLIKSLGAASGPLSFDNAQQDVAKGVAQRLESINQTLRAAGKNTISYRPYAVNTCSRQAFIKP